MTPSNFPEKIKSLPRFSGRFDAFRLAAEGCEIFFAEYPADTKIEPHMKHSLMNLRLKLNSGLRSTPRNSMEIRNCE
jgi:hypothetical protein